MSKQLEIYDLQSGDKEFVLGEASVLAQVRDDGLYFHTLQASNDPLETTGLMFKVREWFLDSEYERAGTHVLEGEESQMVLMFMFGWRYAGTVLTLTKDSLRGVSSAPVGMTNEVDNAN